MTSQNMILRLTSLVSIDTAESVEEVMRLVFYNYKDEFDENTSVYLVSLANIDRIKSEHTGHTRREPETRGAVIIESPHPHAIPHDDGGFFRFRRESHQEIQFNSEAEALLLAEHIFNNLTRCVVITGVEKINVYIASQILISDLEWFSACKHSKTVRKWVANLCSISTQDLFELVSKD